MSENEPLKNDKFKNETNIQNNTKNDIKIKTISGNINKYESKDLNQNNNNNNKNAEFEVPDGGTRGWLIMISGFLCNGVIFGIINTYSVLHSFLKDQLSSQGDVDASSKAALVGSLTIGTTFIMSPIAGILTDKIGLRLTTFIGGVLSVSGMLLSSFFTHSIETLYFTYGIMFGLGASLAYTPTLAILGQYFKKYLGKVNGFVTAGSSVFTIILPISLDYLVKEHGLEVTLQVMSVIASFIIFCSIVYKPLQPKPTPPQRKPGQSSCNLFMKSIVNTDIWKRKKYVIWALCVALALFGYFVPYVHMVKFIENSFPGQNKNLPVMCIGISSGIGRILFGILADLPQVNRIVLQQIALFCIGILTILLPLTNSYILLIVFTLTMGLFDGCFISILGPIAHELCGPTSAAQAIGFLLGLSSIPLTIGPPIAGKLFDSTQSYTLPFILSGIPPIVGAIIMFLVKFVKDDNINDNTTIDDKNTIDIEKHGKLSNGNTILNEDSITETPLMNGKFIERHSELQNGNVRHLNSDPDITGSPNDGSDN